MNIRTVAQGCLALGLFALLASTIPADSTNTPADRDPTFHLEDDDDEYTPPRQDPLGTETNPIPAGTLDIEFQVEAEPNTRWEAVKKTLQDMFIGYVNGDLSAFMSGFSGSMEQDVSIFRNAVQEDFQQDTSINVDIQIVEYRVSFDQICTRFLWNRNAVDQKTGNVRVQTGETYACFGRHDGFKINLMQGQVPFGINDPQLQTQVKAGQVNEPLGNPPTPSPSPTPTTPPPPVQPSSPISVTLTEQSGNKNVYALDLSDSTYSRHFSEANGCCSTPIAAGPANEDVYLYINEFDEVPFLRYQPINGTTLDECFFSTPTLANVRNVAAGATTTLERASTTTFGVTDSSGGKGLVVITGYTEPAGFPNSVQFTVDWRYRSTGNPVQTDGTVDCN